MSLSSLLPAPLNKVFDKDDEKTVVKGEHMMECRSSSNESRKSEFTGNRFANHICLFLVNLGALQNARSTAPPYGSRRGFIPRSENDYGDGGAYPEIHVMPALMTLPHILRYK